MYFLGLSSMSSSLPVECLFFSNLVSKDMELRPNCGSDRAWVWTAPDFADEEIKTETLAIRFANAESEYLYQLNIPVLDNSYLFNCYIPEAIISLCKGMCSGLNTPFLFGLL